VWVWKFVRKDCDFMLNASFLVGNAFSLFSDTILGVANYHQMFNSWFSFFVQWGVMALVKWDILVSPICLECVNRDS
jgi:hypothetical protein